LRSAVTSPGRAADPPDEATVAKSPCCNRRKEQRTHGGISPPSSARRDNLWLLVLVRATNLSSIIRWGLSRLARYQKLSDELIVPNLDQDISFCYDPSPKVAKPVRDISPGSGRDVEIC